MKVELENVRLHISGITETAHVGIPDKGNGSFKHKKEVHNDFLHAVISCWKGRKQIITSGEDGKKYEISVRESN